MSWHAAAARGSSSSSNLRRSPARNKNLAEAGLADLVEFREGDALETLGDELPDSIDLVLIDGAKSLYLEILKILGRRLRARALVIVDDADSCPEYLERVRSLTGGSRFRKTSNFPHAYRLKRSARSH